MPTATSHSFSAPYYGVPTLSMVSVEHPCIIKSGLQAAVDTLGGLKELQKLSRDPQDRRLAKLNIRPEDPFSKIIDATNVKTRNLLLKATVPKPTGRKRKRGSNGPWIESTEIPDTSAINSLRSGFDNLQRTHVRVVGHISHTHRFRSIPDFVDSTAASPFLQRFEETILPFKYDHTKEFRLEDDRGAPSVPAEIVPPPIWSHTHIPFNYNYRQNPSVKAAVDSSGTLRLYNTQASPKQLTQYILYSATEIPTSPPDGVPDLSSYEDPLQNAIGAAQKLFEERPIWSKRALLSAISQETMKEISSNQTKYIYQHLGYMFENGPWRDACVKYGLDPRTDPTYRQYQTVTFMLDPYPLRRRRKSDVEEANTASDTIREKPGRNHIFDGRSLSLDGKTWQICDITDPQIRRIASTPHVRQTCDKHSGFFHDCTLSKIKVLARDKIDVLLAGRVPRDGDYERLLELPEVIEGDTSNVTRSLVLERPSKKETALCSRIRGLIVGKRRLKAREMRGMDGDEELEEIVEAGDEVDQEDQGEEENDGATDGEQSGEGSEDENL